MDYALHHGDCFDVLKTLPANSVDSIVTDPPGGIGFMGVEWDSDKGGRDQWIAWLASVMRESLRVLKPGGHALVWALPRTSHWTATALEDAGFIVRDRISHLFGTGFPKSHDVSKAIDKAAGAQRERLRGVRSGVVASTYARDAWSLEYKDSVLSPEPITEAAEQWAGWGTALKPAVEDYWLVQKPLSEKTIAANVLRWGVGGLNIDAARVEGLARSAGTVRNVRHFDGHEKEDGYDYVTAPEPNPLGRWPAHLLLSHAPDCNGVCAPGCPVAELDGQSGILTSNSKPGMVRRTKPHSSGSMAGSLGGDGDLNAFYGDSGGASRFFTTFRYLPKASRADRGAGNTHPTAKNTELGAWLARLITPPGGVVLDPFMGSGSFLVGFLRAGFKCIGIEGETEYYAIAERRMTAARQPALLEAS